MRRVSTALLALVLLSGCSAAESAEVPDGISLSVYQNRTDVEARTLEVSFLNGTDGVLTVTRLELRASQFVGVAIWPRASTTIPSGATISLPVPLPGADCAAAPTAATVEFDYRLANGRAGTAVAEPVDTLTRLPGIREDDCIAVSVASVVDIRSASVLRLSIVAGRPVAEIDLVLTPTGAGGSVTLASASSTTLLTPVGPDGVDASESAIGREIVGTDAPSTVTLAYAPNRCDAHAIAEDKRGTIFPVAVTTSDGFSGHLYVASSVELRGALYDFVRTTCGLPLD